MRFLSLFSGIEAASTAWVPLGWECVAVAEIEPFPCKVLAHHHSDVPNLGDVTKVTREQIKALGRIDLVVFGSPCQDLSIAGKRRGFQGERSGLFTTAIRIVRWARQHCDCRFALWENVFGAFSSHQGRDFAVVVEQMAGCEDVAVPVNGWGAEGAALGDLGLLEWCVLDAQWFGVAQRRRRVFALADFGDWSNRPPILLEPESLRGDSAPRREAGKAVAALTSTGIGTCGADDNQAQAGHILPVAFGGNDTRGAIDVATARNTCGSGRLDFESETFLVQGVSLRGREGGATAELSGDVATALRCGGGGGDKPHVLAPIFAIQAGALRENPASGPDGVGVQESIAYTLEARAEVQAVCVTGEITHTLKADGFDGSEDGTGRGNPIVAMVADTLTSSWHNSNGATAGNNGGIINPVIHGMAVRRLTPRECERLMGQKDDFTRIPVKKAKRCSKKFEYVEINGELWQVAADGPRYKSLGNSMAVTCMAWIGRKIDAALLAEVAA